MVLFLISWYSQVFGSELKEDEDVIIFPSYLYLDQANSKVYNTTIHIQVFKKKEDSLKRKLLIDTLKKQFQIEQVNNPKVFEERVKWFLVDNKRDKELSVLILGESYKLNKTEANGHSSTQIQIKAEQIGKEELLEQKILVQVEPTKKNTNSYKGHISIIPQNATCLISDIDDTIKISDVRNKKLLIQNTFVNPFVGVEGMQKFYTKLHTSKVDCFVFVSASPWQLYPVLSQFFSAQKFPDPVYLMKYFRIKDSSFLNLFENPESYKIASIEPLIREWKDVRFILVGDSGEKDPEAYSKLAQKYPDRISKIYIRNVYEEPLETRIQSVFKDIEREKYQIFQNPEELK